MTENLYPVRREDHVVFPVRVDRDGVTGVVSVTFTDEGHVYVSTEGHVNNDYTVLAYRGEEYLASIHAHVDSKGAWHLDRTHATRRASWTDAPRTYAEKISSALLAVAHDTYASNPDAVRAGELRQARFALESAERDLSEAEVAVKVARLAAKKARQRVADAQ